MARPDIQNIGRAPSCFIAGLCLLGALGLSSCTTVSASSPSVERMGTASTLDPNSAANRQAFAAQLADASVRSKLPVEELRIASVDTVTWPDSSLGCPRPGTQAMQVLTRGQRLRVIAGSTPYDFHLGPRGAWVLCPPDRAVAPLPPGGAAGVKGAI
jgi:hypothetical protein